MGMEKFLRELQCTGCQGVDFVATDADA